MEPHVGRGVGAQRPHCLVPLANVGEQPTHQLGREVFAPMLPFGLDVRECHDAVVERVVGKPDDRSIEQQLVPIVVRTELDGEAIMLRGSQE